MRRSSVAQAAACISKPGARPGPCAWRSAHVPFVRQERYNSHVVKDGRPFRMAVIGSGPAGFYATQRVMSVIQEAKVDMYEYLPVPFGLVRYGVAPDHPEVKNCQDKFTEVATSSNFNFVGNVEIGRQLPLGLLKEQYDAILFAYGASEDKRLGVPGEDRCSGIYSARHFVGWYNGLPEYADLEPDLSIGDTAVIIGQGNVALDVARILLKDSDALCKTDITERAISILLRSKVKHVHVIGRRGPMQASFTIKEVRELMNLPNVLFKMLDPSFLPPLDAKLPRTQRRLVSLLRQGSQGAPELATKTWSLDAMLSPQEFQCDTETSQLKQILYRRTEYDELSQRFKSRAKVKQCAKEDEIPFATTMAFRSIGYRSIAIEGMESLGIKFDDARGIIPNDPDGRVIASTDIVEADPDPAGASSVLPGLYCAGWVKRGPAGVIANTMEDSFSTADAIAKDWAHKRPFLGGGQGWDTISSTAKNQGLRTVSWPEWVKIDAVEKVRGKAKGREREKITSIPEMLAVLG